MKPADIQRVIAAPSFAAYYWPDVSRSSPTPITSEIQQHAAAVVTLLDADQQYDAALEALSTLNRHIAENGWMEVEFDALRNAGHRVVRARITRHKALAALTGAA